MPRLSKVRIKVLPLLVATCYPVSKTTKYLKLRLHVGENDDDTNILYWDIDIDDSIAYRTLICLLVNRSRLDMSNCQTFIINLWDYRTGYEPNIWQWHKVWKW